MADQLLSSATTFVIMAVAARWGTPAEFAAFGVAFTLYILILWVNRSMVSEPFVVRFTVADPSAQRAAAGDALSASMMVGLMAGALMALIWAFAGPSWSAMALMGITMPVLLVQDMYRYLLLASGRPDGAARNDATWLIVQSVGAAAISGIQHRFLLLPLLFGGAAACAALVGRRQVGYGAGRKGWREWFACHGDLGRPFLYEVLGISAMPHITLLLIAALGSVVTVGAMRAAFLLLGPATVLSSGIFLIGMPEAAKARAREVKALLAVTLWLATGATLLIVLWGGLLALVPAEVGVALLGANWNLGRGVLLPATILTVTNGIALAGVVGLRTLEAVRRSLPLRAAGSLVMLASAVLGRLVAETSGAAYGLALGGAAAATLTWKCLADAARTAGGAAAPAPSMQPSEST